jgi:hypothetical protein
MPRVKGIGDVTADDPPDSHRALDRRGVRDPFVPDEAVAATPVTPWPIAHHRTTDRWLPGQRRGGRFVTVA